MKRLQGSYTVEAAFVMTTVLWVMASLIQFAYNKCCQTTGILRTHAAVEMLRHREDEEESDLSLDSEAYKIQIKKGEKKVSGYVVGADWEMTIESRIFEPEEFLRLLTMVPKQSEEEGEVK